MNGRIVQVNTVRGERSGYRGNCHLYAFGSLVHLADAITGEQQIFWIYVPCLDEAAGLLGTSAGVRLVYESPLIVHEVAQVPAGAGQSLAKVLAGDLHYKVKEIREKGVVEGAGAPVAKSPSLSFLP